MNFAVVRNADTFWGKIIASELAGLGRNLLLLGVDRDVLQLLSDELGEDCNARIAWMIADESDAQEVQRVCDAINDRYHVDVLVNLTISLSTDEFAEVDIWSLRESVRLGLQVEMEFTHQLLPNLQLHAHAVVVNLVVEPAIPSALDTVFQASRSEFHQLIHRKAGLQSNRHEVTLPWTTADMEHTMVVHALRYQIRETLDILLNSRSCETMNPTL